jgi:hypothetical protein
MTRINIFELFPKQFQRYFRSLSATNLLVMNLCTSLNKIKLSQTITFNKYRHELPYAWSTLLLIC